MSRKMLVDATHEEEMRVAVVDGNKLIDYDYESIVRKQLKGSIFLAKVTRVEPSLQAAFVNFGGNRHGFLPFSEIHPDYFRIPIADREAIIAEQEEEMERRRALEEAEDLEYEKGEASDVEEDDDEDDEDEVVELGGDIVVAEDDEEAEEKPKGRGRKKAAKKSKKKDDGEDEAAEEDVAAEAEEQDGDAGEEENASADAEGEDQDSDDGNKRGRRRRGGRNRGRGRGRGGRDNRRSAAHSRKVEIVGGDGIEGDHPVRPSLRRNYKIQEVIKRGQIMLIQVSKEERGNKGAAVTSYLSLPGRYCVLMPNSPRAGGVSRKIANFKERRRMRDLLSELSVPQGMSVIMRTAGVQRTKAEVKRDLDYLMRLWDNIRELTLKSSAPAMINEEGNLIRRSIRDIYAKEIDEILVSGDDGYKKARDFMKMLIPSHVKRVKEYKDERIPLFHRYQVESQIADMGEPTVVLPSGGYLVINPTEALVSVDVNSGRATKERHIEETALTTNLEAAEEVARQLRLRDLGGLVVIDFIDMEDRRNNYKVERKLKEALSSDRARIQVGRISSFGLLELSRQRLNPSLTEAQFEKCPACKGAGHIKTVDTTAINALRALEEEGIKGRCHQVALQVPNTVALYILNNKRDMLADIERRYEFSVLIRVNDDLAPAGFVVEPIKGAPPVTAGGQPDAQQDDDAPAQKQPQQRNDDDDDNAGGDRQRGRRGGRRNRNRRGGRNKQNQQRDGGNQSQQHQANGNVVAKDEDADVSGNVKETLPQDIDGNMKDDKPKKAAKKTAKKAAKKTAAKKEKSEDQKDQKEEKSADEKPKKAAKKTAKKAAKKSAKKSADKEEPKAAKSDDAKSDNVKEVVKISEPVKKDYEKVNEEPEKKKKGWWSR